ncbi:MAG: hypothetical protein JO307_23095 [Bryobacterales bacterium]|nr:hypothetical protein [Bryobacterales bacterium]MBV9397407.1 hypothetical protein [Bryobacterales bacterium]
MMNRKGILCLLIAALAGCTKTDNTTDQRPAIVHMLDGTDVSGTITATSPKELTIAQADQTSRVIPMNQVKAIEYAETTPATPATTAASAAPPSIDASHENHYHPLQSAIQTQTYVLAVGTELPVRTEETIDSARAVQGQTYAAEIARNVRDESGAVVIPAGSNAKILIKSAAKGGHIRGASDLVLDLESVSIEGQSYHLITNDIEKRGASGVGENKRTAEFSGGGAVVGAIIGAIAGGGKGAAIGAGSGAGAGAATQILTKGAAVRVPAESILTFKLDRALRVTEQQ